MIMRYLHRGSAIEPITVIPPPVPEACTSSTGAPIPSEAARLAFAGDGEPTVSAPASATRVNATKIADEEPGALAVLEAVNPGAVNAANAVLAGVGVAAVNVATTLEPTKLAKTLDDAPGTAVESTAESDAPANAAKVADAAGAVPEK
jgi:hypothetical protein